MWAVWVGIFLIFLALAAGGGGAYLYYLSSTATEPDSAPIPKKTWAIICFAGAGVLLLLGIIFIAIGAASSSKPVTTVVVPTK